MNEKVIYYNRVLNTNRTVWVTLEEYSFCGTTERMLMPARTQSSGKHLECHTGSFHTEWGTAQDLPGSERKTNITKELFYAAC